MAITIKKGTLGVNGFNLKNMINDCIKTIIVNRLSLRKPQMIRWVEYFPTYRIDPATKEKSISSLHLKVKYESKYTRLSIDEIEASGASLIEFLDFLDDKGAKEILNTSKILEVI
jgi:transposase|tara:strand:+ start:140 stop:484 length:345 start_codon:yes stop_codon:yes gene_type:complete